MLGGELRARDALLRRRDQLTGGARSRRSPGPHANNYGGALGLNNELIVSQAGALDVLMGGLDEKLAERIATIPDVTNVDPGVFTFINVEGSPFFLIWHDP